MKITPSSVNTSITVSVERLALIEQLGKLFAKKPENSS
jgi:hypothetical protein